MAGDRVYKVMLSSSWGDLKEHRAVALDLMGRHGLHERAMEKDAALPTLDKIAASLKKVDEADAYLCVIGVRYGSREVCATRNPENLSLTELEWRRAKERGIPRCTLIMSMDYAGLTVADVLAVSDADKASMAAFRKLAEADVVHASFDSKHDFEIKAMQSLERLRDDLDRLEDKPAVAPQPIPSDPDDRPPTKAPALHYPRRPFVAKEDFVGREAELDAIDAWAKATGDGMLVFQAIGGMGKSMLTWRWLERRAVAARGDWAGRFWYSFYEQGADLRDFMVHALAYIRHQPPKAFRDWSAGALVHDLRVALDARPWLLVLDGLERVLVAYNRDGKEHMSDEDAAVEQDALGLDRRPRDCYRPSDDEALETLAQTTASKLLVSTRLMPAALTTRAGQPMSGVALMALEGLAPTDAEQVLRKAGVRGDGWRIQRFLREKFACHPLAVAVTAGVVMRTLPHRGDFDVWVDDPKGGGDPELIARDLRGRQNHILACAFDGLDEDEKALLGAIALTTIDIDYELLRIINPMRPLPPKEVKEPEPWDFEGLYVNTADLEIDRAFRRWNDGEAGPERDAAQAFLKTKLAENLTGRRAARQRYLADHAAWLGKVAAADRWLDGVLPKLEAAGLLRFDGASQTLDMHPAIRYTALEQLVGDARGRTGDHVSDALASRPRKPFEDARCLDDLAPALNRIRALTAAGRLDAAFGSMDQGLVNALMALERQDALAELLRPFFPDGWDRPPVEVADGAALFRWAGGAVSQNAALARDLRNSGIAPSVKAAAVRGLCVDLLILGLREGDLGRWHQAGRLYECAARLASALDDVNDRAVSVIGLAAFDLRRGDVVAARQGLERVRGDFKAGRLNVYRQAEFWRMAVMVARREGGLTVDMITQALNRVTDLGQYQRRRDIMEDAASWRADTGDHLGAVAGFDELIHTAAETSARVAIPYYQARRACSLVALGRVEEARRVVERYEKDWKQPTAAAAKLFLALGDHDKARVHALAAYKDAWADGPPYSFHWDLEACRWVLRELGEPEPQLPTTDPASIEPFEWEPALEALIEKTRKQREELVALLREA